MSLSIFLGEIQFIEKGKLGHKNHPAFRFRTHWMCKSVKKAGFYDLSKEERNKLVQRIRHEVSSDLSKEKNENIVKYASDEDTYIRKNIYTALGRLYRDEQSLRDKILGVVDEMLREEDEKVRQTAVYTLGEIGKIDAGKIVDQLEKALSDEHHSVRNAVLGSLKQMGAKNPFPTLEFARRLLYHPDPIIRRIIVHGIELRGRTNPEDILPLLAEMQDESDPKVMKIVIHVLSQISYKKGCLYKVISALKSWENKDLVKRVLEEILSVHKRYEKFSELSVEETSDFITQQFVK
ncbi:hypothetical protein ES703_111546 [subsurface metagenome]